MRLLITGGRNLTDCQAVFISLDMVHEETPVTLLIHGGARGADSLAGAWAAFRQIPVRVFPANWDLHGKAAGPIRNQQMLTEGHPDAYLAFPGGRGTADMVQRCIRAGVLRAPQKPRDLLSWTSCRSRFTVI